MNFLRPLVTSIVLWTSCATFAQAHAFLDSSEPAVGSTVHGSPSVVKIWFTRHVRAGDTTMAVFDSSEKEIDQRDAKVGPSDPNLLTVTVPGLPAGTYKVVWKAVCFDDHATHGDFTFTVTTP